MSLLALAPSRYGPWTTRSELGTFQSLARFRAWHVCANVAFAQQIGVSASLTRHRRTHIVQAGLTWGHPSLSVCCAVGVRNLCRGKAKAARDEAQFVPPRAPHRGAEAPSPRERGSMARYLVTGGAGFIGSHIADALLRRGDQVRVLDNFSTGFRSNLETLGKAEVLEGDIGS